MPQEPPVHRFFLASALASLTLACSEDSSNSGAPATGGTAGTTAVGGAGGLGGAGGGGGTSGAQCGSGPPPPLALQEVGAGFDNPLYVTSEPADSSRLYVLEKAGRLMLLEGGSSRVLLDIESAVASDGERGLLGLAFHPSFEMNRRLFVHYNDNRGDTVIAEFALPAGGVIDPSSERVVLTVAQPAGNHNGGMIEFGPDGYLYIGLGDGGAANDLFGNGQNAGTQLGSMLRVDVDAYPTPPPGNLPGAHPDVMHIGLRNPWRWSFDRVTGDLYLGDVGQNLWEEVSVAPSGSGNHNFGWPIMEANHCFGSPTCDQAGLTAAIAEFANPSEGRSVVGGYVYRGSAIPGMVGRYIYSDYYSERVWTLIATDGNVCEKHEITSDFDPLGLLRGFASFGEDADGELYAVGQNGGAIYRIVPE